MRSCAPTFAAMAIPPSRTACRIIPRTIHATCEDYRAAATIDLLHDRTDVKKKLRMPVLVLWGKQGVIERFFRPLRDWREVAINVTGRALPCGHFLPEEQPAEVWRELQRYGPHQDAIPVKADPSRKTAYESVLCAELGTASAGDLQLPQKTCSMKALRHFPKMGF